MLTGQAKTDYQREYMRRRRAGLTGFVRPKSPDAVRPDSKVKQAIDIVVDENMEVFRALEASDKAVIPTTNLTIKDIGRTITQLKESGNYTGDMVFDASRVKPETNPKQERLKELRKLMAEAVTSTEPVRSTPKTHFINVIPYPQLTELSRTLLAVVVNIIVLLTTIRTTHSYLLIHLYVAS